MAEQRDAAATTRTVGMTDEEQLIREAERYEACADAMGAKDLLRRSSEVRRRLVELRMMKGVLAEAAANASGRQYDAQTSHGWDQIMADIEELLRAGSISESQAEVAVGSATSGHEDPVLQRLRERYGQEQDVPWLWSDWQSPVARSRGCCECNGVDDGTPMVKCDSGVMCLKQWFHVACIGMQEPGPRKGGKSARYLAVSETSS
jgi:hypothetical protein